MIRPLVRVPKTRRAGLTLIELLVVIGLISLLMGFLLPAVQAVRESSRRLECANHLRQIGIAIQVYHDAQGCYPPGRLRSYDPRYAGSNPPCTSPWVDKSFLVSLLPMIDQVPLYNSINQSLTILGAENQTIHTIAVSTYSCPDDSAAAYPRSLPENQLAGFGLSAPPGGRRLMMFTSYAGCTGPFESLGFPLPSNNCRTPPQAIAQNMGVFCDVGPIRAASISDGLSQTLFVAEKTSATLEDLDVLNPDFARKHGWSITGNWGDTLFTSFYKPNAFQYVTLLATDAFINSASSLHPGGINILLGDGSVRFVKDSIDSWPFDPYTGLPVGSVRQPLSWWSGAPRFRVWQSLSTRSGWEPLDPSSF